MVIGSGCIRVRKGVLAQERKGVCAKSAQSRGRCTVDGAVAGAEETEHTNYTIIIMVVLYSWWLRVYNPGDKGA